MRGRGGLVKQKRGRIQLPPLKILRKPEKASTVQVKTIIPAVETSRQQLGNEESVLGETCTSLRRSKRYRNEGNDPVNDNGVTQILSPKRVRLQSTQNSPLVSKIPPLSKTPELSRTLRSHSKIPTNNINISHVKIITISSLHKKVKANNSSPKKTLLSKKNLPTRKDFSVKTKTDTSSQKGNIRLAKQPFQKSKKAKAQLITVAKKRIKQADENNNEATKPENSKEKRKPKDQKKDEGKVKKRRSRNRLDPKPFVTEYLKDPTFYSREPIPHISTFANSRLLIRAVLLEDNKLLEDLINDSKSICSFLIQRSLNVERNAFSYALERGNIRAMDLLMDDSKINSLGHLPSIILSEETTGFNSTYMFGHAVRSVTVGRGGREGNNALLKDKHSYYTGQSAVKMHFFSADVLEALCYGHTISILQEITSKLTGETWEGMKEILLENLQGAIRAGHNQLAGQLVKAAVEKEGYGFNKLHQEVLLNTTEPLSPFKSVSVLKKPHNSPRITPLHCVCINPNPDYLTELLKSNPVYDVADQDKWLPIHYASVCSGKGPLEVLLSRGVSINQYTKEGESPLHFAASLGRVENIELLLAHQAKNLSTETLSQSLLERKTKSGNSPLHLAVQEGKLEAVKCLIRGGANLNRFTPAQFGKLNPLMIAAQRGHLDILKFLIENDAKIEAVDNRGRTALVHAVIDGQAHIVSYLLRLGANHKIMDSSLNTLVHYAAAYGWYFNLKLLLEAGCPLNEENAWKMTPLVIAFSKGHMGIVEFILGKCDVNINSIINDKNGMTLLLQTCDGNPGGEYISKIKFLVEQQNADATIPDFNKNNALHFVVRNEAKQMSDKHENSEFQKSIFDVAKLLIDRGCDPFAKNSENISPIFLAFNRKCFLLTNKFLDWGYSVLEEKDFQGNNFLHIIATVLDSTQAVQLYKRCSENLKYLEKMKEMSNVSNQDGYPPLLYLLLRTGHVTDEHHKANIFEYLLFLINTLDADITAVDFKENSIFHMLIDVKYMEEALALFLPLYSNLEVENYEKLTPLALAISKSKYHEATVLINAGANVNIQFTDGNSLLMKIGANESCSLNFLQLVLKKGANIHDVNKHSGNRILHYIVQKPNQYLATETVEQLIEAGVDVNATNKDGRTALHLVVNSRRGEIDSSYEIEKLLIRAGANLGIRDNRGRLPLHMAFVKIGIHTDKSFIDPIELVAFLVGAMKDSVKNFSDEIVKGDNFGATALHYAAFRGASICCSYLTMLMDGHKDDLDNNGNTPFGLAVLNGHEGCSLQFKQLGADFSLLLYPQHKANTEGRYTSNTNSDFQWNYIKYREEERKKGVTVPKHPIIEEVIRKDWQGILYLMLETLNTSGVGCSLAIASAIRTKRMKLTDKLVEQAIASELKTKDGNSLLHTLGEYDGREVALVQKIAKVLVLKGLSTVELNADGCTPLILPAINHNDFLCQILTELTSKEDQALFNTFDKYGRNAVNALFWNLDEKTVITEKLKTWAENLMTLGVTANTRCAFPIELQPFPSIRFLRRESQLQHLNFNYTPLIFAVIVGNHDAVKWLVTMKGQNFIDINGTDHEGRTALMHAVRLNDIKMIKLLLDPFAYDHQKDVNPWQEQDSLLTEQKSSEEIENMVVASNKLSFSIRDKRGWTVSDYLVASFQNFYFAKSNIILNLLGSTLQLQQKAGDGLSPLERAIKLNRVRLVQAIEDKLGIDEDKRTKIEPFKGLYQSKNPKTEEDFMKDCQEMTKLILDAEKASKASEKDVCIPDPVLVSSDTSKEYTVIMDEKENTAYNCSLVHVDLSYGTYGLHNFYKMQVVEQERGSIKLILLFTRWGRMGDSGQYQKTPFAGKEEAIKEFKKVFRAKTGNSWENLNAFVPVDKKYRLVNEESQPVSAVKIDFSLFKMTERHPPPENTNDDIIKLMTAFYRPHSDVKYDSFFARGSLTRETYQRGEEILGKIAVLVENKATSGKNANDPEMENITKAIEMLSEEYYSLIPGDNFSSVKIKAITSESDIRRRQEWIHRLIHLNLASQIILAAQYRLIHHKTNPFEYIYRSLNSSLQVLEPSCEDAQLILEYIHNSGENYNVKKIFSVERFGEPERLKTCGVGNPWLLWHGTDNVNLLSIFQSGLQVAPFGTRLNGDLFGRGIYFSDKFSKSARYCRGPNEKYVFMCEVALGNVHPVNFEYSTGLEKRKGPPTGCHSLKTSNSLWEPDPSSTIIWKERTVPLGRPTKNPLLWTDDCNKGGLNFNEYIIFNENQVALRYLIEFV